MQLLPRTPHTRTHNLDSNVSMWPFDPAMATAQHSKQMQRKQSNRYSIVKSGHGYRRSAGESL
jgi:hypothetical protein